MVQMQVFSIWRVTKMKKIYSKTGRMVWQPFGIRHSSLPRKILTANTVAIFDHQMWAVGFTPENKDGKCNILELRVFFFKMLKSEKS